MIHVPLFPLELSVLRALEGDTFGYFEVRCAVGFQNGLDVRLSVADYGTLANGGSLHFEQ
jgi:hypothetical protein